MQNIPLTGPVGEPVPPPDLPPQPRSRFHWSYPWFWMESDAAILLTVAALWFLLHPGLPLGQFWPVVVRVCAFFATAACLTRALLVYVASTRPSYRRILAFDAEVAAHTRGVSARESLLSPERSLLRRICGRRPSPAFWILSDAAILLTVAALWVLLHPGLPLEDFWPVAVRVCAYVATAAVLIRDLLVWDATTRRLDREIAALAAEVGVHIDNDPESPG